MHPVITQANGITHDVIDAAIEVHIQDKRPGLLESIYERYLTMELQLRQHVNQNQKTGDRAVQPIPTDQSRE